MRRMHSILRSFFFRSSVKVKNCTGTHTSTKIHVSFYNFKVIVRTLPGTLGMDKVWFILLVFFTWWVPSTPMPNEIYCFYFGNRMECCNSWSRNMDSTTGNLYSINCCASSHPCQTHCLVSIATTRHCPPAKDCRGASPWFVGTCWEHPTRQCEWWRHFWWLLFLNKQRAKKWGKVGKRRHQ